jgi:uncharacterized protein (DUF488 family)
MSEGDTTERRMFSIGHSNHSLERFLDLLKRHRVEVLVDTRSHPYSRVAPHFDGQELRKSVVSNGIKYVFMGKELGGRPDGERFYDGEGHVLYSRVAESPVFLDGIRRLERGAGRYRVAVLCSEENPASCHRRLLVGRVLATRGIALDHIRRDGRIETELELRRVDEARAANGQIGFFRTSAESGENAWRSIQSVLHRGGRRTSSARSSGQG